MADRASAVECSNMKERTKQAESTNSLECGGALQTQMTVNGMNYRILMWSTLADLQAEVNKFRAEGWHTSGGPFWNAESRQWCQAVERKPEVPPDPKAPLKLKEIKAKQADSSFGVAR